MDTLGHVEANGVNVAIISNDRHPQIKMEMRVNHGEISHAFDPWHVAKSVNKKLSAASKKSGCSELAAWIPSIVNHLWWCAESCGKDPDVLREKWLSDMNGQVTDISLSVNMTHFLLSSSERRNG